jgi:hypothetical protein
MTSTELEKLIREDLMSAGLWGVVDQHKSQFLEFPDGLFAEIVLNDGSKLADAESVARAAEVDLRLQRIELHVIVRANWTVRDVEGPRPAIVVPGGIRSAWAFTATLFSGGITCSVEVDATLSAIEAIKRNVREKSAGLVDEGAAIKETVKEFLRLRLSFGGESYWDPLRERQLDLNEDALSYWLGPALAGKS